MRIGSLFSGIGGLELGLEWAGLGDVVWQVEQDPWCRSVLAHHWPDAERFDDVCSVGAGTLQPVDLICGGFPCQDVSAAGHGAGLGGTRSGLWYEFDRIVGDIEPAWVVVENVASGGNRWVDAVRGCLEQRGYQTLPVPLSAQDVGAPHLRRRIFIVAHAIGEQLRDERKRGPGRRSRGICAQGNTKSTHDGGEGFVADADSDGKQQPSRRLGEKRGWFAHGGKQNIRHPDQRGREAMSTSHREWWAAEPALGRVAFGVSNRARQLRALGNAVVPQCAQVVGEVINMLRQR